MKKRVKSDHCYNCNHPLSKDDNYCPYCGQENDNKRQSFGLVMADMITSFLSLESKFANSLPAILFKPGHLTREFIEGKRQKYLAPARMYITIVVIYFLISSIGKNSSEIELVNSADSSNVRTEQTLIQEGPLSFRVIGNPDEDLVNKNDSLDDLHYSDSDKIKYAYIRKLVKNGVINTEQLLDSIKVEKTLWNRFYYSQVIKFAATEFNDLKSYFSQKLPWIFFMLVPVFALILKLMYVRRKYLYIDHLIFTFHLFTFYFILAVVSDLIYKITGFDEIIYEVIIALIYSVIAFKRFYMQNYLKTILKILIAYLLYLVAALIAVINLLFIMFILY